MIAGQGTVALEMLADAKEPLDVLVVPIGGGGLISGIALAAKAINPAIEIIGVQTQAAATTDGFVVRMRRDHQDIHRLVRSTTSR